MSALINQTKFLETMLWASTVNVLAGVTMWAIVFGANAPGGWRGLMFSAGALAGILALALAHGRQAPTVRAIRRLGGEMAAVDGPPPADQIVRMAALQTKMASIAPQLAWLVTIAVAGMALAN
jgi:hypothetical protein